MFWLGFVAGAECALLVGVVVYEFIALDLFGSDTGSE